MKLSSVGELRINEHDRGHVPSEVPHKVCRQLAACF